MLVNAIPLKLFPRLTSDLKIVYILSRGRMLLILSHLLKRKWPPWNFLIDQSHGSAIKTQNEAI